ncbi:MAG: hypothetical protein K6F72_05350, partial [Bacteroidales bacterium]|nr:hypothetical protein [Bacteroidales bacterium]
EVKEHPDPVSYVDSIGTTRVYIGDEPCVRVYAPVVKKMSFYNPYYKSDVKVYRTDKYEMNDVLFMSNPYKKQLGPEYTIAYDFLSEIDVYIIGNIYRKINHEGEVILKKK